MKDVINGFFKLINREAAKYNQDRDNYEMSEKTFFAIFWRLEAVANPSNDSADYVCAAWLKSVYERYTGENLKCDDYFIDTVVMERASELDDNCKPYAVDGWFAKAN